MAGCGGREGFEDPRRKGASDGTGVSWGDVARIAGRAGIGASFGDLTWYELEQYAKGRAEATWEQVSFIAAIVHNAHITKKSQVKQPAFYNPFERLRLKQMREQIKREMAQEQPKETLADFLKRTTGR